MYPELSVKYWGDLAPELKLFLRYALYPNEYFCWNNFIRTFIWDNEYNANVCNGKSSRVWCANGCWNEKKSCVF